MQPGKVDRLICSSKLRLIGCRQSAIGMLGIRGNNNMLVVLGGAMLVARLSKFVRRFHVVVAQVHGMRYKALLCSSADEDRILRSSIANGHFFGKEQPPDQTNKTGKKNNVLLSFCQVHGSFRVLKEYMIPTKSERTKYINGKDTGSGLRQHSRRDLNCFRATKGENIFSRSFHHLVYFMFQLTTIHKNAERMIK
jgi:hypothetical protein